jgi:hypothetical protein
MRIRLRNRTATLENTILSFLNFFLFDIDRMDAWVRTPGPAAVLLAKKNTSIITNEQQLSQLLSARDGK